MWRHPAWKVICRNAAPGQAELLTGRDASADWQGRGGEPSGRCCLLWHRRCGACWPGTVGTEDCLLGRRGRARAPSMHRRRCGASWKAGRGAVAEQGRCRAFAARNRRCCGARAPTMRRHRCGARALAQSKSAAAGQGRWQKARVGAGRQILSDSPSDLAITSAAQVLPYVFTAVRGISQSC